MPDLERLFRPRTIAVIGASTDPSKIGGRPLAYSYKHNNGARVYAVNPNATEIQGFPCYPDIRHIPDEVDLVLIGLPAARVLEAVRQSVEKKVKFGIIFSSGFGEMGEEGQRLEREVVATARQGGMRLIGPNCQGIINLTDNIIASFTPALTLERLTPGHIGLVCQSGAFAGSIFNFAQQRSIGLSRWVSIGNQADLDVWDCFADMLTDEHTRVLGGYVEGIKDGSKMLQVAEMALEASKPIVLLKGGLSEGGSRAALSHTGSIAGSAAVARAAMAQKGIIRVDGVEELFDIATVFAEIQKPARDGIGVLTTSGAAGVLITDRCEEYGLNLASLSQRTKERLKTVLPEFGSVANPVDLTAQMINEPEIFTEALDIFVEDENIGLVLVMFTMVNEKLADICAAKLVEVADRSTKPIVVCWMATKLADQQIEIVRQAHLPVFETPYRCVRAVNALVKYHNFILKWSKNGDRNQDKERKIGSVSVGANKAVVAVAASRASQQLGRRHVLTEMKAREILQTYGIPTPRGGVVHSEQEALDLAAEIGYPVVAKVESPDLLHRSDAGAIRLNITSEEELREAYVRVIRNAQAYNPQARIEGVSIQKMVPPGGVEVIVGLLNDTDFGPAIMFGLGGIFVEVLKDVAIRIVPLTRSDAEAMVREIKGYPLLTGARGQLEADVDALVEVLLRVSELLENNGGHITEFEINPLIVLPKGQGVVAADCMVTIN